MDEVFVYDCQELQQFSVEPFTAVLCDLIDKKKPSAVLVGGTTIGRSLAPRVAAGMGTGMTAYCTRLNIQPNTDLDKIQPAFDGNIMAHIQTTFTRPQFATMRNKTFPTPTKLASTTGRMVNCTISPEKLMTLNHIETIRQKKMTVNLEIADVIVAAGWGIRQKKDM